jgi:DNA recombination protein Rad52
MTFNPEQIAALSADLSRAAVRQRKQAGRQLSYIEGWHAEAEANRIFGYHAWDSEVLDLRMVAEKPRKIGDAGVDGWSVSYIAKVRVIVTTPTGQEIVRDGVGAGHGIDRDLGLAHESAAKEAVTDAEKRALKTFGNPFGLALYDKEQRHVSDDPPGHPTAEQQRAKNGGGMGDRKSSAQAKRDGDDAKIKADIAKCDREGLKEWHLNFDSYTASLPLSWLDSVRDMLESRLIELNGAASVAAGEAELDDAFRGAVAGGGTARVAGRGGEHQGAAA